MFEDKSLRESLHELASPSNGCDRRWLARDVSGATITLHSVCSADEPLLYRTYASTRTEELELTGWNSEMRETFLRLQYDAQRHSYRSQLPNAEYLVIRRDDTGIGRLIIDRTKDTLHVVDIALLPDFRRMGIGSILMRAIMKEASQASKEVRLHVERFNPALQWYERLGFRAVNSGPIYLEMTWRAGPQLSGCDNSSTAEPKQVVGATDLHASD
jgi:ribosomal protein S18 acetylase RimI-like enzyme